MQTSSALIKPSSIIRKPRVSHSKAHWHKLITAYENSSLTQQAFCQQHKISTGSLHKWRKRMLSTKDSTDFIEISDAVNPIDYPQSKPCNGHPSWQVELELGQGIVLRVKSV